MYTKRNLNEAHFVFFGGSSGVGRATALALAADGAHILIVGRGTAAGEKTVSELRQAGAGSADFLAGDLSTVAGVEEVAKGVAARMPVLHGIMHSAMSGFSGKQITEDGLEFAFALQYFARAALNRLLVDQLAASGDGRIVHLAGNVPASMMPDLDDLQFEQSKWGFFKAVLGSHNLGFLHLQEAAKLWADKPVTITATCIGSTKTKAMLDPKMPLIMRLMGKFGTTPQKSAQNAIRVLSAADISGANGAVYRKPKAFVPAPLEMDVEKAAKLWKITADIGKDHGVILP